VTERQLGERILNTLDEQRQKVVSLRSRSGTLTRTARPEAIVPKSNVFEEWDVTEVARQICLFEQNIFTQIHPKECLDLVFSMPDRYQLAPMLMKLIDFFNAFSNWVATTILKYPKPDERARELKRFVRLSLELRRFNNFNACQEVLAGLADSSIHRLHASWLRVGKDEHLLEELEDLRRLMSPDKSWATYRNLLKEVQPPCIPYLGVYLTDLTFIEDGNPNYLPTVDGRKDIINFEKCRKQAVVIGNILLYQNDLYNFERVDAIFDYFARGLVYQDDKDKLYKLSKEVEPQEMVEEAKRKAAKKSEKAKSKGSGSSSSGGGSSSSPGGGVGPSGGYMASKDRERSASNSFNSRR